MTTKTKRAAWLMLILGALLTGAGRAQEAATRSQLTGIALPQGALRVTGSDVPKEATQALDTMMQGAGKEVRRGRTEVLAWTGGSYKMSRVPGMKTKVAQELAGTGWQYEEGEPPEGVDGFTLVTAIKTAPTRRGLIGFWAATDEALLLAWTEMLPAKSNGGIVPPAAVEPQPVAAQPVALGATALSVSNSQYVLNVMKGQNPKLPSFPALKPKPGKVCGFVKDANGKPLHGAVIGVRSTAVGGAETGAEAKTDARGYYEILVPFGAAGFYCAGYTRDWGDGRGAFGLKPADGEADEFATPQGHVENWVLVPYGIADRDGASDQPQYLNNYFGGSITLTFRDENSGYGNGLPFGTVVEITLTPQGALLDGSKGRSFVIRKTITDGGEHRLYLNNIPIGRYRFGVRAQGGGALSFKETGPDRNAPFGIDPREGRGSADLMFRPYGTRAASVTAAHGNWKEINIDVFR